MINERMTFRLKYGKEQEAAAVWVSMNEMMPQGTGPRDVHHRIYKNLTGRTNCITQDFLIRSLADHNPMLYYWKINPKVQEAYAKFVELCESSIRDVFNIECEEGNVKNFKDMIMQRNTFRLQYGKARDSITLWKALLEEVKTSDGPHSRMMTDVTGESYTLVVEAYFKSLSDIKPREDFWMANEKMNELYQKFIPFCHHSDREYFLVEYDI